MLSGYRTYLCAIGVGIATAALSAGWVDQQTYQIVIGLLGAGGLASLRAAI